MEQILREGLAALGLEVSAEQIAAFRTYYSLLDARSKVMNLTAIHGEADTARLHFLDCAALLTLTDLAGKTVVDVGTGAGFPGLPLRILEPRMKLTLLDSLAKRVDFLSEVCGALGFDDVQCLHARAEEAHDLRETFDAALSRAVARLDLLSELCLPLVRVGGAFLAMKGPGCAEELAEARHAIEILGGEPEVLTYAIPGTDLTRNVVRIRKVKETPMKYPRRWAKMQKTPIR